MKTPTTKPIPTSISKHNDHTLQNNHVLSAKSLPAVPAFQLMKEEASKENTKGKEKENMISKTGAGISTEEQKSRMAATAAVENILYQRKSVDEEELKKTLQAKFVLQAKSADSPQDFSTPFNPMSVNNGQHPTEPPVQMVHPESNSQDKQKSLASEFGAEVMKLILSTNLPADEATEREEMTRKFYKKGGAPWDAFNLLKNYPDNNIKLYASYNYYLENHTRLTNYTEQDAQDSEVQKAVPGYMIESEDYLHTRRKEFEDILDKNIGLLKAVQPHLIAIDIALKAKLQKEKGEHVPLAKESTMDGVEIWAYGHPELQKNSKATQWVYTIINILLKSDFLNSRQPSLKIKIIIHNRVSRDVASTSHDGSFITINLEQYQIKKFSPGQMLGLLAHELGVHSLDATTLSQGELQAEASDAASSVTGTHGHEKYTVGKKQGAAKQQDDHLTIGRAVLGQLSSLPRLNMYESTLISFLEAQKNLKDQQETAAAYCIDIARILVTNDNPQINLFNAPQTGYNIKNAAVNEWSRIKQKYGKDHDILNKIEITPSFIYSCLLKLGYLISKIKNKPSYL
jgi:hypothetical protein